MKTKEEIDVYVKIEGGKTVCICKADKKRCSRPCEKDTVLRDKFNDWQSTFHRNRYGK